MEPTPAILDELRAELAAERNGAAAPADPPRFRLRPPLYDWIALEGAWAGVRVEMQLNPSQGVVERFRDASRWPDELPALIHAWNLDDPQGAPLEVSPEGLRELEPDLLVAIITAWTARRDLSKRP